MQFNFVVGDFIQDKQSKRYLMLDEEEVVGSDLIDNLIYLRFIDTYLIQKVIVEKYGIPFVWVRMDTTPPEFKEIAERYNIIISKAKTLTVYVPLNVDLDRAALELDIPGYQIVYKYIANLNLRLIRTGMSIDTISNRVINIRPKLLFRRLILDCIECGGTDIHFESRYIEKMPNHIIRYRIKRELKPSSFKLEWSVTQTMLQTVVAKLTTCSSQDLESAAGITTEVADLFGDATCEVRVTGCRVAAGYYIVMAIQTTTTTTMRVDQLGFPAQDVEKIRSLSKRRTGLTLVTGEMRSGKNTTIFAMLNEIINDPIRIIGYENPIENRMPFPQKDYKGDVEVLKNLMRLAKKEDLDIAMLNEIPNAEVAFAVRDLVNSAIGVITTTHIDRVWHVPYKLNEFFGKEYKTILSQLNAVINQKMFRRWEAPESQPMQKRILSKEQGDFEMFCWKYGVRQYFQPEDAEKVTYRLQPLVEIIIFSDDMKSAMKNNDEIWRTEDIIRSHVEKCNGRIEHKLAEYINLGICSLDEMRRLY